MSTGNEIARTGVPELPAIAVPVTAAPARTRRGALRPVLAILGAAGLTLAVIAPTGLALADPPTAAHADPGQFTLAVAEAQSLVIDSEATQSFAGSERGAFNVYVKPKPKPKPAAAALPRYTGGGTPAQWMAAAGIAESDWPYVDYIVRRESGWNPNATNKRSGACGLVQVYPCSKLPNAYDPIVNLSWADRYAKGRYGSWAGAYDFWTRKHWW